ncbi:hypothetical protein BH10BDE1_BH10BDE1_30820 [soil metagenome]
MSIKIVINSLMGLLAVITFGFFLLGRGLSAAGTKPAAVELVQCLPMALFIVGAILQYVFRKHAFTLYFAFIPLLYFIALQSVYGRADDESKHALALQLEDHKRSNETYLAVAPDGLFTESAEYYLVRAIKNEPTDKLIAVALETPKRKVQDAGGGRTNTSTTGIELFFIQVQDSKMKIWKSGMLKGFDLNPYYFSNVGLYQTEDPNFDTFAFEVTDANNTYVYVIDPKNLSQLSGLDRNDQLAPPIALSLLEK